MRRTELMLFTCTSVLATALTGCGNDAEVTATVPPPPPPASTSAVSLAITPSNLELRVGEVGALFHTALDSANNVVSTVVEWTSDNPGVAAIASNVGRVTAIAPGVATITAAIGTLRATAMVTVHLPVPTTIRLSTDEVILAVGSTERLTAQVYDQDGRLMSVPVVWSSQDLAVASISADGTITGTGAGATVITAVSAAAHNEAAVRVEAADFLIQWASSASASTQYETDRWAAAQAIGTPNVFTCNDEWRSWASVEPNGEDWLELKYDHPVRPTEIRIYEVWAPGSIVKVEVKEIFGTYRQVYSATPLGIGTCLRTLIIPVTGVTQFISSVRISVDQRSLGDWNEIDAVRLTGFRQP